MKNWHIFFICIETAALAFLMAVFIKSRSTTISFCLSETFHMHFWFDIRCSLQIVSFLVSIR